MGSVLCKKDTRMRTMQNHSVNDEQDDLANDCSPQAAVGSPLEFRYSIFFVSADCPPEGGDALPMSVCVCLVKHAV